MHRRNYYVSGVVLLEVKSIFATLQSDASAWIRIKHEAVVPIVPLKLIGGRIYRYLV
jgi:hypothetical protein